MTDRVDQTGRGLLNRWLRTILIFLLFVAFALTTLILYKNSLSPDPALIKSISGSIKSPAAAYTVNRTYTSKANVIVNNLWKSTTSLSIGYYHSCAISNGKAYCWGLNGKGQLGNNSTTDSMYPVATDVSVELAGKYLTNIYASTYHSCGIANGRVYCWGRNDMGQLGNNSTMASLVPVAVDISGALAGRSVVGLATGGVYGGTCAIADGRSFCWGSNDYGFFGTGGGNSSVPVATITSGALLGKTITNMSMGEGHTCAVASGAAYCWGYNATGGLGNNSTSDSAAPVAVDTGVALAGKTVTQISAGTDFTCAVADGGVYCWGNGLAGQLGNGTAGNKVVPTGVTGALSGHVVTQVSAGSSHACALADSDMFCWGYNAYGQLGDGTTNNSLAPVPVDTSGVISGKNVTAMSTGLDHTCAIANGRAYCWGRNYEGQLGNCTTTNFTTPTRVNDSYGISTC